MLIAFEGPDGVGKSYAASKLSAGYPVSNASAVHYDLALQLAAKDKGIVQCFDQISWISPLAHGLAGHPSQPGMVIPMPEVHLVFKVFEPESIKPPAIHRLNQVYLHLAHSLMALNESQDYRLFKTVTIMQVQPGQLNELRSQQVTEFSSPLHPWWGTQQTRLVHNDLDLLDLLTVDDVSR